MASSATKRAKPAKAKPAKAKPAKAKPAKAKSAKAKSAKAKPAKAKPAKAKPAKSKPAKAKPAKAKARVTPAKATPAKVAPAKPFTPRRPSTPAGPLDAAAEGQLQLLRAGALLSRNRPRLDLLPADEVSARAYTHPALGERVVVRLTADAVAQGEDLLHAFLGFGAPKVDPRVAVRARRALGFPAWALVHDRQNARHALDVLGEMRQGIRKARGRPGQAKEVFDGIAKRLGRTVPQFLPSFHEEVGRVFADLGNRSWSGQHFNKAREAERTHALEIDDEARRAAFLEFALSGALTTGALGDYARELSRDLDPATAYAEFRELCLRRTLGGVAPWAGMVKDLRRLAKAAGLDAEREDQALLQELLGTPALNRAPADLWREYRDAIVAVAARTPAVQAALLALAPRPTGKAEGFHDWWLELLEASGAIEALVEGRLDVKPASWLGRMDAVIGDSRARWDEGCVPDRLLAFVRRLAPRLIADGSPVRLDHDGVDVDLCDLLLELGVPLADPGEDVSLQLAAWPKPPAGSVDRPRDPVHLAADPRFAKLLREGLLSVLGRDEFARAARGKQAFTRVTRELLDEQLAAFEQRGLPGAAQALQVLKGVQPAVFADHPQVVSRMRAATLHGALARSLRVGLLDELGWEAFEAAARELGPKGQEEVHVGGVFPYLVLSAGKRAIVVGPQGRVLEHDLRLPRKGDDPELLRYAGGQLFVSYYTKSYDLQAYWSGSPTKTFAPGERWYDHDRDHASAIELPDGGMTEGGRAVRPGDAAIPKPAHVLSDGVTFWRQEGGEKPRLRELDPRTGDVGRASWPRFLEEFLAPGWVLSLGGRYDGGGCHLAPLARGLERSPLGSRDGLVGFRVRTPDPEAPGGVGGRVPEAEGVDGRRFASALGEERDHDAICALLSLPHDPAARPVTRNWRSISLWSPDGAFAGSEVTVEASGPFSRGTRLVPPFEAWHCLTPRDDAGSRALRALRDDVARELLAAAVAANGEAGGEVEEDGDEAALGAVEESVRKLLPAITHPALVKGVAGVALEAAGLVDGLAGAVARAEESEDRPGGAGLPDDAVEDAIEHLLETGHVYGGDLGRELERAGALLFREEPLERPTAIPRSTVSWPGLIGRVGGLAFRLVAPATEDQHRDGLRRLLALWAESPFASVGAGELRTARLRFEGPLPYKTRKRDDDDDDEHAWVVEGPDGRRSLLRPDDRWYGRGARVHALQRAREGVFGTVPGTTVSDERPCEPGWGSPAELRAFLALAAERGPLPSTPEVAGELARRTGLGAAEAALVWAGLPRFGSYDADFLGKALRERLGLKHNEAKAARESLRRLPSEKLLGAYAGLFEGLDPAQLWTPLGGGPDDEESAVAGLARSWSGVFGKKAAIPPEVVAQVQKDMKGYAVDELQLVETFLAPGAAERLTQDAAWKVQDCAVVAPGSDDDDDDDGRAGSFSADALRDVALGAAYLYLHRPVGCPVRAGIPEALRLARERLKNPDLLFELQSHDDDDDGDDDDGPAADAKAAARRQALLDGVGGKTLVWKPAPKTDDDDDDDDDDDPQHVPEGRDNGRVVLIVSRYSTERWVRPAKVKDAGQLAELKRQGRSPTLEHLELVRSDAYTALAARAARTPVPPGEYEANPLLSAPALVAEVTSTLRVSEDAAVLYLETLAHPAPTSKVVQTINHWTPSRYAKAGAELRERKLLVEAKRERAGRTLFLPGAWEPLRSPQLPVEGWKLPFYRAVRRPDGRLDAPFDDDCGLLPLRPIHELYAEAWARVQGGDAPAFETFEKKRRR